MQKRNFKLGCLPLDSCDDIKRIVLGQFKLNHCIALDRNGTLRTQAIRGRCHNHCRSGIFRSHRSVDYRRYRFVRARPCNRFIGCIFGRDRSDEVDAVSKSYANLVEIQRNSRSNDSRGGIAAGASVISVWGIVARRCRSFRRCIAGVDGLRISAVTARENERGEQENAK